MEVKEREKRKVVGADADRSAPLKGDGCVAAEGGIVVFDYLNGHCQGEKEAVIEHLEACTQCRDTVTSMAAVNTAVRAKVEHCLHVHNTQAVEPEVNAETHAGTAGEGGAPLVHQARGGGD